VPSSRILIAEDEIIAAINLEEQLTDLGYESCGIASSAEELLQKADVTHPDLVLMDIKLKGKIDGIEAAETLQKKKQVPVVFVSAFSDAETVKKASQVNPFGYLVKPIQDASLKTTIEIALQKCRFEKQLEQVERELSAQAQKLAESNVNLESFAQSAAHDLMGPLKTIGVYLELIEQSNQDSLSAESRQFFNFVVKAVKRLQGFVTDLIEYARTKHGGELRKEIKLNDIVQEVIQALEWDIKKSAALVKVGELPTVWGDSIQWKQVFQNLVGNSLKYHGDKKPLIEIGSELKDQQWIVSIRDNGIGFDSEKSQEIFESFKRLNDSLEYPGSGLGLAICKKIIEKQGGKIWAVSKKGDGATFFFTVPANQPKAAMEPPLALRAS
jgi:signal transduction histidine kinase